jgi:ring-1,2-phenylacetyl-CoA epoxidase subunit PaaB
MMNLYKKYYYGDFDAIEGGGLPNDSEKKIEKKSVSPMPTLEVGGTWPLWEVFIRSKQGMDHKHAGSLHAADAAMAIENARDVYTRRQEGVSIWVVESKHIHATNPDDAESFYEPANDKVYRHPTFYDLPDEVKHM